MNPEEFWEGEWKRRMTPGKNPEMNRPKLAKIVYELAIRDGLDDMEKLDIGCGTGIHAVMLAGFHPGWKVRWTGIDLSGAGEFCGKYGFRAIRGDIFTYEFKKKFQCFLLLDSLEHFLDHERLSRRILELADEKYYIFANVPLYCQAHSHELGLERSVSPEDIKKFFLSLKINGEHFREEIYGSYGYPYMIAEGGSF